MMSGLSGSHDLDRKKRRKTGQGYSGGVGTAHVEGFETIFERSKTQGFSTHPLRSGGGGGGIMSGMAVVVRP